ncbi:MAG: hypothetical protein ACLTSZ_09020 [Lachnospiraceae bacterium]
MAMREFQKKCVGKKADERSARSADPCSWYLGRFVFGTLKREQGTSADRRAQEYALLLEQAERGGIAQAGNCYRNAAELYPEKVRSCIRILMNRDACRTARIGRGKEASAGLLYGTGFWR